MKLNNFTPARKNHPSYKAFKNKDFNQLINSFLNGLYILIIGNSDIDLPPKSIDVE